MLFHCLYDAENFVSKYFEKTLLRISSNFAIIEAVIAGTNSLKRFLKKISWYIFINAQCIVGLPEGKHFQHVSKFSHFTTQTVVFNV